MFSCAKLQISEHKSKFLSSEYKEKFTYSLLSREKIR